MRAIRQLFILIFLVTPFCLRADTELPAEKANYLFRLPINWTSAPRYNLEVTIPNGLTSIQTTEQWFDEKTNLIEFVPAGENGERWTEITTINKFIGKKIVADEFLVQLKNLMLSKVQNGKVWLEDVFKKPAYTKATLVISYDLNDRHEVMGAQYYSGPYDFVGVQYTILAVAPSSDSEAVFKIMEFFDHKLTVVSDRDKN
jgi:hypothetical protein